MSVSFLCWGLQSWMQHFKVELHQSRIKGQNYLPQTSWPPTLLQPRIQLDFWAASTHCSLISNFSATSTSKSFFEKATFNPFIIQPLMVMDIAMTQVQDLTLVLLNFIKIHRPTPPARWGTPGWHFFPRVNQLHHLCTDLLRGHLILLSVLLMKYLIALSQYEFLRDIIHHWLPPAINVALDFKT